MKRTDLIKALEASGCELVRHGGKHDWYRNPNTGVAQPVPRHREIKEHLAKQILRALGESGRAEPGGTRSSPKSSSGDPRPEADPAGE